MSRLLCCRRHRARRDMGAALSPQPQEGEMCDGAGGPAAPPTMADVIRERKKKAGGAGLGTLRRRIAAAARRHSDSRPDRGCEHARFIRSVVSSWRLAEVFLLCQELEAGAALRDLVTQAELAREPAVALPAALHAQVQDRRWCDVQLGGAGWALPAHRALLAARCSYFRALLHRHPSGGCRVPLDGPCANISRAECEALLAALYAGPAAHCRASRHERHCERGFSSDGNLDIINVEGTGSCSCSLGAARGARRLAERLGARLDDLHRDMRYLLDSGEYADARLSFAAEGGGQFGFRAALELPCHRVVLAARSRFFRSAMSRRAGGGGGGVAAGVVCVDESVLPRRFARALLHAAYTDQVDLTLIGRNTNSPNNTSSSGSGWSVGRGSSRAPSTAMLDDAFQLYEIARFLEMPIVAQGCEDAIQAALSPDSLPHILRWGASSVASPWVHRQAMRYLRDEFPAVMAHAAAARLPRAALAAALGSPFTQCSEAQALRALLRLAERGKQAEPNVVWSSGGARRRSLPDAEALGPLAALLRTSHLAPAALAAAARRGLLPPAPPAAPAHPAARPDPRPPRYFLPYLDELKALLEDQPVPEAEIARIRRSRNQHRIPDTLYMRVRVAARAGRAARARARAAQRAARRARARAARQRHARRAHADRAPGGARAGAARRLRGAAAGRARGRQRHGDQRQGARLGVPARRARRALARRGLLPGGRRRLAALRVGRQPARACALHGPRRHVPPGPVAVGRRPQQGGARRGRRRAVGARARRGHGAQREHAPADAAGLLPPAQRVRRGAAAGPGRRRLAHAAPRIARAASRERRAAGAGPRADGARAQRRGGAARRHRAVRHARVLVVRLPRAPVRVPALRAAARARLRSRRRRRVARLAQPVEQRAPVGRARRLRRRLRLRFRLRRALRPARAPRPPPRADSGSGSGRGRGGGRGRAHAVAAPRAPAVPHARARRLQRRRGGPLRTRAQSRGLRVSPALSLISARSSRAHTQTHIITPSLCYARSMKTKIVDNFSYY